MRVALGVALFVVLLARAAPVVAAPTPTAPPTYTPAPTYTPYPSPTTLPSASPTPLPSPTKPPGIQKDSGGTQFCVGPFGCFDIMEFISSVLGSIMQWLGGVFAPSLGVPAPTVATATPTPRPGAVTPTPAPDLLHSALAVTVAEPDLTGPDFVDLQTYGAAFAKLGEALFSVAILFYVLEAGASFMTSGGRKAGAIVLSILLGRIYLSSLAWAEHGLYGFMNDLAQWAVSSGPGIKDMEDTLVQMLSGSGNTTLDLANFTFNAFSAIVIFALATLVLVLVELTRISGLFLLALFQITGPVFVALYLLPGMGRVATWWLRSWLQYLLWAPIYAVLIQATLVVIFGLRHEAVFGNPIVQAVEALAAISVLLAVPRLTAGIGGMAAHQVGALNLVGAVRSKIPLL